MKPFAPLKKRHIQKSRTQQLLALWLHLGSGDEACTIAEGGYLGLEQLQRSRKCKSVADMNMMYGKTYFRTYSAFRSQVFATIDCRSNNNEILRPGLRTGRFERH